MVRSRRASFPEAHTLSSSPFSSDNTSFAHRHPRSESPPGVSLADVLFCNWCTPAALLCIFLRLTEGVQAPDPVEKACGSCWEKLIRCRESWGNTKQPLLVGSALQDTHSLFCCPEPLYITRNPVVWCLDAGAGDKGVTDGRAAASLQHRLRRASIHVDATSAHRVLADGDSGRTRQSVTRSLSSEALVPLASPASRMSTHSSDAVSNIRSLLKVPRVSIILSHVLRFAGVCLYSWARLRFFQCAIALMP